MGRPSGEKYRLPLRLAKPDTIMAKSSCYQQNNIQFDVGKAMKRLIFFMLLTAPLTSQSFDFQNMNEAEMDKMMQQMEQMQSCMEKVNEKDLKALEQRSKQMEREVKALCNSGKRDEAQKKAIEFGKEITKDPTMAQMRQCGEMMKPMLSKMAFANEQIPGKDSHVCDAQ